MSTLSRRTLTVTYSIPGKDGDEHHAVIALPASYEQAVMTALRLLGKYVASPPPGVNDVLLKVRERDREGRWIWAAFDSWDWELMVPPGSEIGLFAKHLPRAMVSRPLFLRGPVFLAFGTNNGALITWSVPNRQGGAGSWNSITRPGSFSEAVESTKTFVKAKQGGHGLQAPSDAEARVLEPGKTLNFYVLFVQKNTAETWIQIPPDAVTDEESWKAVVPEPFGVLGVIAQ
ncbi:hypothetical protein R3P38DRAFT_2889286 [Favolaschia claudopus]|uniref:Uncharacterized protein n=1 Tax=Favolaschia claudopus TaxID=2862362 RepID=A0AAW0CSP9_9AGAR